MTDLPQPMPADGVLAEVLAEVLELLAREHVLTLACHDADGAWAAPVFYALDGQGPDFGLVFVSSPRARHVQALRHDARCAGAVHAPAQDWQAICGVQLAGPVEALHGAAAAAARAVYERRFAFVAAATDGPLAAALQQGGWFRLRPDQAVLVDNRRGLGQRRRWQRGG